MKILKFGGTSVGKPERMKSIAQLIQDADRKIVVLSALSGTTNALVAIGEDLASKQKENALHKISSLRLHYDDFIKELYAKQESIAQAAQILDTHFNLMKSLAEKATFSVIEERILLAQGELLSTQMFQVYLQEIQLDSVLIPALEFMRIDKDNEPALESIESALQKILVNYPQTKIFVTQGYICLNHLNEIDNLKRGGSDYTASLVGAATRATEIQIWTDIDGMHNNDPRFVKNTHPVQELSFEEAAELAYFGAKILHPASILPAQKFNIPVRLLNTLEPTALGTTITNQPAQRQIVKSIAAKEGITAIKIKSSRMLLAHGFLRKVFEVFEKYKTSIDVITTSEVALSVTIDNDTHLKDITSVLKYFGTVEIDPNLTIICIVGDSIAEQTGLSAKIFNSLKEIPVRMISFGGSNHNVTILINSEDKVKVLNLLNEGLF